MKEISLNLIPSVYNNSLPTVVISEENRTRRNSSIAHEILTVTHFPPDISLKKNHFHDSAITIKKKKNKK